MTINKINIILLIIAAYCFGIASGYFIYSAPPLRFAQAQTDYDKTIYQIIMRENHFQLRVLELHRELEGCQAAHILANGDATTNNIYKSFNTRGAN